MGHSVKDGNGHKIRHTVTLQYWSVSELIKPYTHHILTRKIVAAFRTCSGLIVLVRSHVSHEALQEKMLHCSVLVSFGTHHEFQNKLTMSTEVPPYMEHF